MRNTGHNMEYVRKKNIEDILKLLQRNGMMSRKDLAKIMGLSGASLTIIINQLIQDGIVYETGEQIESKSVGRKKILVAMDYKRVYFAGVSIDNDNVTVYVGNMYLKEVDSIHLDCSTRDTKQIVECISNGFDELIRRNQIMRSSIYGVGLSIIGIVDKKHGFSHKSWGVMEKDIAIVDLLKQQLGLNVYVENNVRALALASLYLNSPSDYRNFILVKFGNGIGSAIYIEEKAYEGTTLRSGELGHIYVSEAKGKSCRCGKEGCLETIASMWALRQQLNEDLSNEEILQRYEAQDRVIKSYIDQAIIEIAKALTNYLALLDPQVMFIYGFLFENKEIVDKLYSSLEQYVGKSCKQMIQISNFNLHLDGSATLSIVMQEYIKNGGK